MVSIGAAPSISSEDTAFTASPASFDTIPAPAAKGNTMPATNTPIAVPNPTSIAIGRRSRRGMSTSRGYANLVSQVSDERLTAAEMTLRS